MSFNRFVPSGIARPPSAKATFRVLAEGDPDVDAPLASAVGCSPPPRSLTPPRPPRSDQSGRAARRCGAAPLDELEERSQTFAGRLLGQVKQNTADRSGATAFSCKQPRFDGVGRRPWLLLSGQSGERRTFARHGPSGPERGGRGGVSDLGGGEQPTADASAGRRGGRLGRDAECRLCARRPAMPAGTNAIEGRPRPHARACV